MPRRGTPRQAADAPDERRPWDRLRQFAPFALLLALALPLVPGTLYGISNDGVAYVSIAQDYAAGRFAHAVNGYWSPLLSWLLAPLLAVGFEPLLAARLLSVAIAVWTLDSLRRLLETVGVSMTASTLTLVAAVPFLAYTANIVFSPDLLVAGLLLRALALLLAPAYRTTHQGLKAGGWLGAAYLAKLYALPFSLALVPLVGGLHMLAARDRWRLVLRNVGVTLGVFAVVVGAWASVLSLQYGRPTAGTSAGYNVEVVAPGSRGAPVLYAGLLVPPHEHAVSAWDDLGLLRAEVESEGWGSGTASDAERFVSNIVGNLRGGGRAVLDLALLPTVVALLTAAVLLRRAGEAWPDNLVPLGVLVGCAVYSGGYVVTFVEPRYLWFPMLALFALVAVALERTAARRRSLGGALAVALTVATALSVSQPLEGHWRAHDDVGYTVAAIQAEGGQVARIASADDWQRSSTLCLYLDCQFYGHPQAQAGPALEAELERHAIDLYLVWHEPVGSPSGFEPLDLGEGPRAYRSPSSTRAR